MLILAALQVFNEESLIQFLTRTWDSLSAGANQPANKTVVHLCSSHIINKFKKFAIKHYKKNISFALHCLGLLMNVQTFEQAEYVLHDVLVALQVEELSDFASLSINRLLVAINTFDVTSADVVVESELIFDEENKALQAGRYSEEDFLSLADTSPFKAWGNRISSKIASQLSTGTTGERNRFFSDVMAKYILTRCIPILPLWSSLLLENLSTCASNNLVSYSLGRTNSAVENRFRILKHVCLGGNKGSRLDDFSKVLENHTLGIQRISVAACLKDQRKSRKRSTRTVCENWNKRQEQNDNIRGKVGRYQRPPVKPFVEVSRNDLCKDPLPTGVDVLVDCNVGETLLRTSIQTSGIDSINNNLAADTQHANTCVPINIAHILDYNFSLDNSSIEIPSREKHQQQAFDHDYAIVTRKPSCLMRNINSSCWFNSCMQALSTTLLANAVSMLPFNNSSSNPIECHDHVDICLVSEVLRYMTDTKNYGLEVPTDLLNRTLHQVCNAKPASKGMLRLNQQNDVAEFISSIISELSMSVGEDLEIETNYVCTFCGCVKVATDSLVMALHIPCNLIGAGRSVKELIANSFVSEVSEVKCQKCSKFCSENNTIVKLPITLLIILKRYTFKGGIQTKIRSDIFPDVELDLSAHCRGLKHSSYALRSIICHNGTSSQSGHYVSYAYNSHNRCLAKCDDMSITTGCRIEETLSDCYVIVYDRIAPILPEFCSELISCYSSCEGLRWSLSCNDLLPANPHWRNCLESIECNNISHSLRAFRTFVNINFFKGDSLPNSFDILSILHLFHKFLFEQFTNNICVGIDSFSTVCHTLDFCRNCDRNFKANMKEVSILSVADVNLKSIMNFLNPCPTSLDACSHCHGRNVVQNFVISSLPQTLIVVCPTSGNVSANDIMKCQVLTVTDYFTDIAGPLAWDRYLLVSDLVTNDIGGRCFIVRGNKLYKHNGEEFVDSMDHGKFVTLFFNRSSLKLPEFKMLTVDLTASVKALRIGTLPVVASEVWDTLILAVDRFSLERHDLEHILGMGNWLNSNQINYYMQVVAKTSPKHIHVVDCGWFSQRLFYGESLSVIHWAILTRESTLSWCDFDLILIPFNVNNVHWQLIVVDIQTYSIHFFDSLKQAINPHVAFQILRYLSFEYILSSGVIDSNGWQFCDYALHSGFPAQTDSSSCGVHICVAAKAMSVDCVIPSRDNLDYWLRQYVVQGILEFGDDIILSDKFGGYGELESVELSVDVTCPTCTETWHVTPMRFAHLQKDENFNCQPCRRTVQLENASHRRAQKVREFVEMVQMETTIEFGKHKRDPREKDVLNLYKYINENCLQCTFPCDPAKVVLVSAEPDRKRCGYTCMATNLEHPLLFRYVVVFGVNNENYEELYHTLVHEIDMC